MPSNTFIAKIVKRGNSATITIPKGIADVYGIGTEIQVRIKDAKTNE